MLRRNSTCVWLVVMLALFLSSSATAAAAPATYKATIEGSVKTVDTAVDTGLVYTAVDTFKVSGLKFKRVPHSKRVAKLAASYKITAGKVTWTRTMSGGCVYSYSDSFPITSVIGESHPLQFDKYSGRWKMLAEINTSKSVTFPQQCITRDGSFGESEAQFELPRLMFSGGTSVNQKPKRTIRRTFRDSYTDKSSSYSAIWKLTLKS